MITPQQMKAARAFAEWDQKQLAAASGVSLPTIQRMEKLGMARSSVANATAVKEALESAGVEFTNGDQPGVRMKRRD
jgi:DNA-binding XRE family transcriptional regulator